MFLIGRADQHSFSAHLGSSSARHSLPSKPWVFVDGLPRKLWTRQLQRCHFQLQPWRRPSRKLIFGTKPKRKRSRRSLLFRMSAECNFKVQMFSMARDVSLRNSEINNVGGALTINNYNFYLQPDLEPVQVPLSSNAIPFFHSWLRMLGINLGSLDPTVVGESFTCSIHKHNETWYLHRIWNWRWWVAIYLHFWSLSIHYVL